MKLKGILFLVSMALLMACGIAYQTSLATPTGTAGIGTVTPSISSIEASVPPPEPTATRQPSPTSTSAPTETFVPSPTFTSVPTELPTETQTTTIEPPTPSPLAPLDDRIVFVSSRQRQIDIYTVKPDGSDVRQVSNDPLEDYYPSWSPDRKRLAYVSYTKEGEPNSDTAINRAKIFLIHTDGNDRHILFNTIGGELFPSWSPDGGRILFSARDLLVANADGGQKTTLLVGGVNTLEVPTWSPDGRRIAYMSSDSHGPPWICLVNANGTYAVKLTPGNHPAWSPDGTRIAFDNEVSGEVQIFVINVDASGLKQLTSGPGSVMFPDWSPDGTRIVYASGNGDDSEIYVMNADGSNPIRLTDHAGKDTQPAWRK